MRTFGKRKQATPFVPPRTDRTSSEPERVAIYGRRVKLTLAFAAAAAAFTIACSPTGAAMTIGQRACVVPRLYTLTIGVARSKLAAAGCTLGTVSYQRPRIRNTRIADQVPPPGAVLPLAARVSLIVF